MHSVSRFQNGITLGYQKYFSNYFWKNIFENIFEKNIYKKYFQYPSVIPFWNRETKCDNMALIKNLFWELKKYFFFKITLYQEKSNLALVGQNLHSRKNLQKQISFIHAQVPRNELVSQNSKKKPLSQNPNYMKDKPV